MAFNEDPFAQARAEVANKSMGDQIAHSGIFHSLRSAFSSGGSAASKGAGAVVGVGKLFLALIPVPIVGAVVGAAVDVINGKIRGGLHDSRIANAASKIADPNASAEERAAANADYVKFSIKELTVENLDRYRWKVARSFEELNAGLTAYNNSNQSCDDMYAFALLYEQVERRKQKLTDELQKFVDVTNAVNQWIIDLNSTQGALLISAKNAIAEKTRRDIGAMQGLVSTNPAHATQIQQIKAAHAGCEKWCCVKRQAKYDPNTNWETLKTYSGKVANLLAPVAAASVAVRQSDYTNSADNSKFTS